MRPTHVLLIEVYYLLEDKIWDKFILNLLGKTLPSVQHMKLIALIFLLCLHSCIVNENKSLNVNDNYSQLTYERIENLNVNDYHLAQGDSGQPQRQLGFCILWL